MTFGGGVQRGRLGSRGPLRSVAAGTPASGSTGTGLTLIVSLTGGRVLSRLKSKPLGRGGPGQDTTPHLPSV